MIPSCAADAGRKRAEGRYYTIHNPFDHPAFRAWAADAGLPGAVVLEPFAGAGHLLRALETVGLGGPAAAYDLAPGGPGIGQRNTLADFLAGHDAVVTPPYLARNSAARRGLLFPETLHPDLYLHCLDLCLRHARFVAAIVPDSFLQAGRLQDRCQGVVSLPVPMFGDTERPVCLALFGPDPAPASRPGSGRGGSEPSPISAARCPPARPGSRSPSTFPTAPSACAPSTATRAHRSASCPAARSPRTASRSRRGA